jgi:hypothetical protein
VPAAGLDPEVHYSVGGGEAVIPDALVFYQRGSDCDWSMPRAFVEVDRATIAPCASGRCRLYGRGRRPSAAAAGARMR